MRRAPTLLAAFSFAVPVLAQNPVVDLSLWTTEHLNGSGPWTVDPPRLWVESTNAAITDCSVFHSDFDVVLLDFRMRIDVAGGDDDIAGFVLGWQPGNSTSATADYVVVDWKRTTQAFQNWGTANAGLAISRVTGPLTRGYGNGPIDLWSHTLNCTELQRSPTYGARGWDFYTDYWFRVLYTTSSVDVWLDGVREFGLVGTFPPGRFGCYNYSQSRTGFQFPLPGSFQQFGTGCQGSAGVPYMFSPAVPYAGSSLPIITANLNPAALPLYVLGLSRTFVNSVPLPVALGPYGAPGCSLFVSGDLLLFVTNYQGTAYATLALPAGLIPNSTPVLFVQGMVLDPAANALGVVMSNAAEIAVGVR